MYEAYLGDLYKRFKQITTGLQILNGYKSYGHYLRSKSNLKYDSITSATRELYMYNNFIDAWKKNEGGVIFGQFGRDHIDIAANESERYTPWPSLAAHLNYNPASPACESVCSIALTYSKSDLTAFRNSKDETLLSTLNYFYSAYRNKLSLYDLKMLGSIYEQVSKHYHYMLVNNY